MATPERQTPGARELILSEEQLRVSTRWVQAAKVTASVRIVTEVKTLQVEVRRQELVITELQLPRNAPPASAEPGKPGTVVLILSEEVPEFTLRTQAYERVTLTVDTVTDQQNITADLAYEELEDTPGTPAGPNRAAPTHTAS